MREREREYECTVPGVVNKASVAEASGRAVGEEGIREVVHACSCGSLLAALRTLAFPE